MRLRQWPVGLKKVPPDSEVGGNVGAKRWARTRPWWAWCVKMRIHFYSKSMGSSEELFIVESHGK